MNIHDAREYIEAKVMQPALASDALKPEVKSTIQNTLSWLPRFERIGDLIAYMDRFQGNSETPIYRGLKDAGLLTFEDIHDEFMTIFGKFVSERTRLDDFVIGQAYSGSHLVIFAELYDNRSGGILRIGKGPKPQAVFVKATLSGGKYANEWIEEPDRLKYYLKSRNYVFSETYVENAAIIDNPEVPVFVFHRQTAADKFTFAGIFQNECVHHDADGSKWFEFARTVDSQAKPSVDQSVFYRDFSKRVALAEKRTREQRLARLKVAAKIPTKVITISTAYSRNPDVVAEVLFRAAGTCEGCDKAAPFPRNKDGSPYLEVHHKIHLAENGEDTVENSLALCPNCHRREHFGQRQWA